MGSTPDVRTVGLNGATTGPHGSFREALLVARNGWRTPPLGTASDRLGAVVVDIPPGDYRVTDLHGLMGLEKPSVKIRGLRFRGAGSDLTHVIFDPAEPGVLAYNRLWQNIGFDGITFSTTSPGSVFMNSWADNGSAAQSFVFNDVKWSGPWRHVLDLNGDNNNSEVRFTGCMTSGMEHGGSFLHIGAENTSDQFLNYWITDHKHWSTDAALIDAAKGGHFHITNLDASGWAEHVTEPTYLFNLRGRSHAAGVMSLTAHGVRVEAQSPVAGLLYSEWSGGNIELQADWTSQAPWTTYGDIIHLDLGNTPGPVVNVHDSNLAGGIRVAYGVGAFQRQQSITVRDTTWGQRLTPSEVVFYDEAGAKYNLTRPAVRFVNCRGDAQDPFTDTGASVWDAVVNYNRGPLTKPLEKRAITVRGIHGNLREQDAPFRVNLPVGALITGVTAVSPATTDPHRGGGVWAVTAGGAEVARVTVDGPMRNGYHQRVDLPVPYLCATREQADLTVKATGAPFAQPEAFLTVEGYW